MEKGGWKNGRWHGPAWWQKRFNRSQRFQPRLGTGGQPSIVELGEDGASWGRDAYLGDKRQPSTPKCDDEH
eukprot:5020614-Alexandrium_andersonii.AAC.1